MSNNEFKLRGRLPRPVEPDAIVAVNLKLPGEVRDQIRELALGREMSPSDVVADLVRKSYAARQRARTQNAARQAVEGAEAARVQA